MNKTLKGIVKTFNPRKGFGFIGSEDGNDVFVHHSEIKIEGVRELLPDQVVLFEIEKTDRGYVAREVRKI